MPTQVQFRRGTSAQNDAFTGASGEISIDLTNKTIRVHDGSTTGGRLLATNAIIKDYLTKFDSNIIPQQMAPII